MLGKNTQDRKANQQPLAAKMVTRLTVALPLLTLLTLAGALISSPVMAGIDVYEFDDPVQEALFQWLVDETRCPKCQNQNVADSDAMIAKDIKNRVYEWIQEGKGHAEITAALVDRYGDFVTYRPPMKSSTWLLWWGPPLLFLIALSILLWRVKRKSVNHVSPTVTVNVDDQAVDQLLEAIKTERKQ